MEKILSKQGFIKGNDFIKILVIKYFITLCVDYAGNQS